MTNAPPTLTPAQKRTFWIATVVVALSRLLARSRTLWDWDEALFCLGMRGYDVASHHPHPPGFPVYIAMARLVRPLLGDDFRALQAINLVAGMLLFPALVFLGRELHLRFETALAAGLICAFLPNVWFFGGTAFSDVPSLVAAIVAAALLLRGQRDRGAYLGGSGLLSIAAGIRPQNLLLGLWPGVTATWQRRKRLRDVAAAAVIGIVICAAAYGTAAALTGPHRYLDAVRAHSRYIAETDSFRAPGRPSLLRLTVPFFLRQYQSPPLSIAMSLFVVIAIVAAIRRRDRRVGDLALIFAPVAIAAWLMLDRYSVNRFSIGYIPLFAFLAAYGIDVVAFGRQRIAVGIAAALAVAFAAFTWPALQVVRTTDSPTFAAVRALRNLPPSAPLYVDAAMVPFVEVLAPERHPIRVFDQRSLPLTHSADAPWLIAETVHVVPPQATLFQRAHTRLWNIARRHFFDVALIRMSQPEFVTGWSEAERTGDAETRSTSRHAVARLPGGDGRHALRLELDVPHDHATIVIMINGVVLDSIAAERGLITRQYDVTPRPANAPNELTIDTVTTSGDAGTGVVVRQLGWGPR